ncbi:hypothetical protein C0992_000587 [Termitomyces sp. T32_za158]|nr:hypothetical protein C0992_000587 [Termitomyces sp. T32_za158]
MPSAADLPDLVGTGMLGDPNATPMARDDVNWSHVINTSTPGNLALATPTPTGFHPRRRATSMFTVRTPTAVPDAFLQHSTHPHPSARRVQPHYDYDHHQPPPHVIYGAVHPIHAPVPLEDLSGWSAKLQAQRPPELRLAAAKVKARRQTLAGGEREREHERNNQLHLRNAAPVPSLPFCLGADGGQGQGTFRVRDSASPVDPHTRSSSSSTASWESTGTGTGSESGMRPAFKRLPSATPLEHDREHKRALIDVGVDVAYPAPSPAGGAASGSGSAGCGVGKIDVGTGTAFDAIIEHEHGRERVLSYTEGASGPVPAEGVLPTIEDQGAERAEVEVGRRGLGLGVGLGAAPGRLNLVQGRGRVDGGDMLFGLQLGAL